LWTCLDSFEERTCIALFRPGFDFCALACGALLMSLVSMKRVLRLSNLTDSYLILVFHPLKYIRQRDIRRTHAVTPSTLDAGA
jgi:hypothetical protein